MDKKYYFEVIGQSKCLFVWIKTPSFKDGVYEVDCECDDCFMTLRDAALLLSKVD